MTDDNHRETLGERLGSATIKMLPRPAWAWACVFVGGLFALDDHVAPAVFCGGLVIAETIERAARTTRIDLIQRTSTVVHLHRCEDA